MTETFEARDVDGQLYVSALGLTQALEKAREQGKEIERAKWMCMLTPYERRMVRIREACAEVGVTLEALMNGRNGKNEKVVQLRQRLFYEFREEGMSLPEIGRFFNRDHTTVRYGIQKEKERREQS
jgi:chromosomal replication initiation ATPase DnaA